MPLESQLIKSMAQKQIRPISCSIFEKNKVGFVAVVVVR